MKTYLFDFDGTLVDSMKTYVSTILNILKSHNIPYGDDVVKIITPLGTVGSAKYLISLGVPLSMEEIIDIMKRDMLHEYLHNIMPKNNVVDTLKALKGKGCSLNVLTASPHVTLDPCLKRIGIYDIFDNVWSCDDFGLTKSDPNIYVRSAQKIGVDVSEILFVDDNCNACITARTAGMKACGVYDDSSKDFLEETKSACDYFIYDFAKLLEIEN